MKRNLKRTCRGKTRYRDQQEAVEALHRLQVKSKREVQPTRVYECPICNGYHLTSKEYKP